MNIFDGWRTKSLASFMALALGFMAASVCAQQAPPAADPGRLRERLDIQAEPQTEPQSPELRSSPAAAQLPVELQSIRVRLEAVRVEGSSLLPDGVIQAEAARYIGRDISGSDLLALASALTAVYRNAGYILSQVIVPPQSLANGELRLRVVEGYIERVFVQAGAGVPPSLVARLEEAGEKIRASRPLQASVLERYLLIANDFPGVELRSVLAPSQAPAAADLTLIASVKKLDGFVALDNYGSRYLGPGQVLIGVGANQLLGLNDQWRIAAASTGNSEMAYGQLSYSQILTAEGLKVGLSLSRARTRPGDVLKPFDVRGRADTVSLLSSYPLLRGRNESLVARMVYDHSDIATDILGTRVIEDRIRALRLGLGWRVTDSLDGQNVLDIDFSQGVGGTKDSDLLKSRVGASGKFQKLTFDYERSQFLSPSVAFSVGVGGQWANTPLLSSEQYALGGRRYGRAYEPAELAGERALALRIEPRYLGVLAAPGFRSYQFYGFYDIGKVWLEGAPTVGVPSSQSLSSTGIGIRLFMESNVVASLEAALPLTKPIASHRSSGDGKDLRLLGSMVFRF